MAVRELTETEVELFEEDLAAAAQSLESREERMQEVSKTKLTNFFFVILRFFSASRSD